MADLADFGVSSKRHLQNMVNEKGADLATALKLKRPIFSRMQKNLQPS
jgi:hypothetical protein